ncbi:MAG: PAS domain S-box-containing protein, partial [Mariniblastus sp.]
LGLWTWDTKHNRIIWSNQIHESADIESEAEIGTVEEFLSMVHREDRIAVESSMNRCIQDGEPFRQEFRFKRTDGSYRWVLSMAHGIDQKESGFSKMAGVEIDITERKEWEIRLAKMEKQASDHSKRLAMALKSGDMAAWEWTPDGSVWTEDVFRMLGIPKQMASSDLFFSFVHAEDVDELKEVWARATGGEDTYYHEFRIIRPTGEVRWMVGVGEVVRNQNGQVKNVYGLNWDSTEEHVTAERLRASERAAVSASESKSEFLANMSHEIRTPMSAIIGYSDILARHLKDPDDLNCVSIIRDNGNFLLEIMGDILDISKIEAGKFEIVPMTFRVGRLVADVRSLMHVRAVEKLLELSVELDGQIPKQIKSDSKRLKQILVNLIGNAIKFTESGSVKIVVRYLASGPRPKIRFDISDTGIGMTEAQQKKVFQPFTQADASVDRKFGGTGLGLAISQRLAHMLGGEITIKSELGIGSTFSLTISIGDLQNVPMIDNQTWDPTAPALQKRLTETPCLDGLFLVVDDRREIRFIAQHFIEDAGGTVATGENGQEAIDAIEKAESAGMPFDLLVIDMQMPILDGYEATRRLRAAGFEKPIIALTAHAMEGDREECLKAGCTDYISKPLDGPRFTQLLQGYLSKKSINTPSDSSTKKILIIDDAHQAADAVSILLSLNGHDVRTANDGESGIELAKSFGPEVVLIDLGLPDMTGFEVLKQLRENSSFASTKFIAATGRDNHDETSKAGFHHHIVKPIDVDKLEKWLQSSDRRET